MKRLIAMLLCLVMVAAPVCASAIEQEIISNPSNPRITHTESDQDIQFLTMLRMRAFYRN